MLKIFRRKTNKKTNTIKTIKPTTKKWVLPLEVEKISDNTNQSLFNYNPWK